MGEGGENCLKYLKRGGTEGRVHTDFKKRGKLGQGVVALKRGAETPLRTMHNFTK